jgi:hypothetical protein
MRQAHAKFSISDEKWAGLGMELWDLKSFQLFI